MFVCKPAWMNNGGLILWKSTCNFAICPRPLDKWEKLLMKKRSGKPFKGPVIPFGAMVEYYPISSRDQSRAPPILARKFTWHIPQICINCGRDLEQRYYGCRP